MLNDTPILASVAVALKAREKTSQSLCFLQVSPYFLYLCVLIAVVLKATGEGILVDVLPSSKSISCSLVTYPHSTSCFPRLPVRSFNGGI